MLPRNLPNSDKVNCFFFGVSSSSLSLMAPPLASSEEDDDDDEEMTSLSTINDDDSIVLISPSSIAEYRRERNARPVAPTGTTTCSPAVDRLRSWQERYRYIDSSKQCNCRKCRRHPTTMKTTAMLTTTIIHMRPAITPRSNLGGTFKNSEVHWRN